MRDALLHQLARLEHLERDEAVERRERCVPHVVRHGLRGRHAGGTLVLDRRDDLVPLKPLASREMRSALRGNSAAAQHVERALELRGEILLEQLPRIAASLSRWRCVCPCSSVAPLLHDDFLAGADEPSALLANPFERRLELLFGLDTAAEVAAKAHRRDALPVDGAAQLRDGGAKARVTRVTLGAELGIGRRSVSFALPRSRGAASFRCWSSSMSVQPGVLTKLIEGLGVCRHSRPQCLVVASLVLGFDCLARVARSTATPDRRSHARGGRRGPSPLREDRR